jgi:hypothetical protein
MLKKYRRIARDFSEFFKFVIYKGAELPKVFFIEKAALSKHFL